MRSISIPILIAVLVGATAVVAQTLPPGVVAYYPMSGDASDAVGAHDGTVHDALLANDRFGQPESAYVFDGDSDHIMLGTDLKVPFPITVTSWVKPDDITDSVVFRNDLIDGWSYYHGVQMSIVDGRLLARVGSGTASPGSRKDKITIEAPIKAHCWNHLAVVFRDYDDIALYVNGIEYAGEYFGEGTGMTYSEDQPGYIGRGAEQAPSNNDFDGRIDEVWFCQAALTDTDIENLYLTGLVDGLLAHYPIQGNAEDIVGENDGLVHEAQLMGDRFGEQGSAYHFDGEDDYIALGTNLKVSFPITVTGWIEPDAIDDGVVFRNDLIDGWSYYHGVQVSVVDGRLLARVGSGFAAPESRKDKITSEAPITVGRWTHIAVVFRDYDDISLYVDGREQGGEYFGEGTSMTYSEDQPGYIGRGAEQAPSDNDFNGAVDDVRFYNAALTAGDILSLYQPCLSASLVACYRFSGNADDETGAHHGTVYGTQLAADRLGYPSSAYVFDGDDDFIDIGTGLKLPFPITVSAWVRPDDVTDAVIFRNDLIDGWSAYHGVQVSLVDGNLLARVGSGLAAPESRKDKITTDAPIQAGRWTHVTVVFRDFDDISLYVDGREHPGEYFGEGLGMTYSADEPGYIGRGAEEAPSDNDFVGTIDELCIFDVALEDPDVFHLYSPQGYPADAPETVPVVAAIANYHTYPNPFNPTCTIAFGLPQATNLSVTVFDIRGRAVCHLYRGWATEGPHLMQWNGRDDRGTASASGTYFCVVTTAKESVTRKLELIK